MKVAVLALLLALTFATQAIGQTDQPKLPNDEERLKRNREYKERLRRQRDDLDCFRGFSRPSRPGYRHPDTQSLRQEIRRREQELEEAKERERVTTPD